MSSQRDAQGPSTPTDLSPSSSTRSGPSLHLLAKHHPRPQSRAPVMRPLAPAPQRIQAAALQGLAHRLQAAVSGWGRIVGHAGGGGRAGRQRATQPAGQLRSGGLEPQSGRRGWGWGSESRWRRAGGAVTPSRAGSAWCGAPLSSPSGVLPPRRRSVAGPPGAADRRAGCQRPSSPRRQRPGLPGSPAPTAPTRRK